MGYLVSGVHMLFIRGTTRDATSFKRGHAESALAYGKVP